MTDAESEKRFDGAGQEFHAKYMGCVEVSNSKGQEVCQEAMQKLLVALKSRKEPKPRLIIHLSYDGTWLKEMPPGINLMDVIFKHSQVSYVWKDPKDQRSLGIIRSEPNPEDATKLVHKFHGIRTIKPALPFLQEMQELFRIVKERSVQQKERAASVAATTADSVPPAQTDAATPDSSQQQQDFRDRAISNLLGAETPSVGLPKNESVASLEDLGEIFSASATISQMPPSFQFPASSQPMGGGGAMFGQPMGGGGAMFGQPMGGGGAMFGQPMVGGGGGGGSPYGQPQNNNPFGQPMGGPPANPFGQPMGGSPANPFGQPMGAPPANPYVQPIGVNPYGQPMMAGGAGVPYRPPVAAPASALNSFGQPQPPMMQTMQAPGQQHYPAYGQRSPVPFGQQPPQQQQQQQQFYHQQQQHQHQHHASTTNPFESGFSVFDRQNSTPAGEALAPVTLTPLAVNSGSAQPKPDAFGDLVTGLTPSDPKRQQVSGKDLFKPIDKPKASLRDLANQSPRP